MGDCHSREPSTGVDQAIYRRCLGYIEYFMESARVRCLHTSCEVSEIEQVSEANRWDFWHKTTSM